MRVLRADDPSAADQVAAALRADQVVVLPTDTVYGLAALPTSPAAVAQLFALKGRPAEVPVAVLCADAEQALALAGDVGPGVRRVAARLWPGPLTLVLPRRPGLGLHLGEPSTTIGLRCPDHELIRRVATVAGPVATTSANRHGEATPADLAEVLAALGPGVAVGVDGGRLDAGASTVVSCRPDGSWQVLRDGPVPLQAIDDAARP
jgi:L-threonylcarbamoyladenylate synthase